MYYGILSPKQGVYPSMAVVIKSVSVQGFNADDVGMDPVIGPAAIKFVKEGLSSGKLKPFIARSFPLDEAAAAHEYLQSNRHFGKVILSV